MPHWSTTDYAITGKHEDISRLHSDFKRVIAIDRSAIRILLHFIPMQAGWDISLTNFFLT